MVVQRWASVRKLATEQRKLRPAQDLVRMTPVRIIEVKRGQILVHDQAGRQWAARLVVDSCYWHLLPHHWRHVAGGRNVRINHDNIGVVSCPVTKWGG